MSVRRELTCVSKSVSTLMVPMSASVSVDTEWTLMDCHAMVGYWSNHNLNYGVILCIIV